MYGLYHKTIIHGLLIFNMENPWKEAVTDVEIEKFKELEDIKVVFDVGARTSLEYLDLKPDAEFHLFEPWEPFYKYLKEATKDKPNVHVNGYGLGSKCEKSGYSVSLQSFHYGDRSIQLPIKTLNWYVKKYNIERIDFLKIDTEGWDHLVLKGGSKILDKCRYIQYETWNEAENKVSDKILSKHFICEDIGYRNMLCRRKV